MELLRQDLPGTNPASWTGRTSLKGTGGQLRQGLLSSLEDERRWFAASQLLKMLDTGEGISHHKVDDFTIADESRIDSLEGFSGWKRTPPTFPKCTPPIPLDLHLPVMPCLPPIDALTPWWNEMIVGDSVEDPLTWFHGREFSVEAWDPDREFWGRDELAYLCSSSALAVYSGAVELTGTLTETESGVKGPGTFGSLVPIYSEMRSLLSSASRQSRHLGIGFRLPFAWIRSIGFSQRFFGKSKMLTKRQEREIHEARGYGELDFTYIRFEVDDGWRPSRVSVRGGYLAPDSEDQPKELAQWLVATVASRRLESPRILTEEKHALEKLASHGPGISEFHSSDGYSRSFRCDFPGSEPISVSLTETQTENDLRQVRGI